MFEKMIKLLQIIKKLRIPADLIDKANEYREKLVEAVAESDDALMEKILWR